MLIGMFFSEDEKKIALKNKILASVYLKSGENVNAGKESSKIKIPQTRFTNEDFSAYEMISVEKAFIPYVLNKKSKLSLYNTLVSYSRLSGLRYYSRTDKKAQPLIIKSFRIDSPESQDPKADIIYSSIDKMVGNYFQVEDNRFGILSFKSEVYNEGDNFIQKNICVQPMNKYGFSINRKGGYQLITFYLYNRKARGYFYYTIHAMRIRNSYFEKLGLLNSESFANRIRAMTVHMAGLMGLDWSGRIRPVE